MKPRRSNLSNMRFFWCATWIVYLGSISSALASLQVVEQPSSATVPEDQAHILTCKVNEPANCAWHRNDVLIAITERYRYVSNNGTNTKDCSFEIIKTLTEFDAGAWKCVANIPGSERTVISEEVVLDVQISVYPTLTEARIVEQPQNASVAHGQNYTFTCRFNEPVNCVWMRSKSAINIGGRRQYLNGNGMDAMDCSIMIMNFTYSDATSWQCAAMHGPGRNYTKEAVSDMVFLSILRIPTGPLEIVIQPINDTVSPGQNHILFCKFSAPVKCSWDRNGTETTIDGRYHYLSNNGTGTPDCSFRISSFSAEFDAKIWQCKAFDPSRNQMVVSDKIVLSIERNSHFSRATLGLTTTALKVVEHPKDATVDEGQTAILTCKFNELVNCAWTPTDAEGRYHYVSNNGRRTQDCSLRIIGCTIADAHTWQCSGQAAYGTSIAMSNIANLSIRSSHNTLLQAPLFKEPTLPVLVQPQNASLFIGNDYLLSCVFGTPVNCTWHITGIPVEADGIRYHYGPDGGQNTANCSFLLENFKEKDTGDWECMGTSSNGEFGRSDKAYLSVQQIIQPNRTAILLNGNPVSELWVPQNGSQNGTLQCVAEYAIPAVKLYWNITEKINPQGSLDTEESCSTSCHCNSTLTWIGDWKQLLNSSMLSCLIIQFHSSSVVTAALKIISEPTEGSGTILSAGAIAGIIIAVLLVVLLIVGILVYCFIMKPRKQKNLPTNITMVPTSNNNDGGHVPKKTHPSPALSEKSNANSTPGNSAETVRMNDRQPQAVPQTAVKVPLVKNVDGESRPNDNAGDSSEDSDGEAAATKPEINTRYSKPFAYIGGKDIFPVRKHE